MNEEEYVFRARNGNLITGIQLHFKERSDAPVFQMVQEDGIWKKTGICLFNSLKLKFGNAK